MFRRQRLAPALLGLGMLYVASGCDDIWHRVTGRGLSRGGDQGDELSVNAPLPDGPRLGGLADFTPIFEKPKRDSRRVGWMHAGAQVARSTQPVSKQDCTGGWYSVYPRGYVCIGPSATLDLSHPTLAAMSLSPKLNEPLPYPYAQARVATEVFAPNAEPEDGIHPIARLRPAATLAVVGSWQALDDTDQRQRLALTTRGTFVRVDDLKAARTPSPKGVAIDGVHLNLPIGFVVTDPARSWRLNGEQATPAKSLAQNSVVSLGQQTRSLGDARYFAVQDGTWVQQSDIAVIRRRNDWPSFANGNRHWVDLDLTQGTVVLYAGDRAVFAALTVSVPKDKSQRVLGVANVVAKSVTDESLDPNSLDKNHEVFDVPWVIELNSGLRLHGTFRQDRPGASLPAARVELTPEDAQRVWTWVDPQLPSGWHAVSASSDVSLRTEVVVR